MHAKPEESLKTERANKPAGRHKWKVQEKENEEAYRMSAGKRERVREVQKREGEREAAYVEQP